MILLGYAVSEDPGMAECAKWLKGFLAGMPVEFLAVLEALICPFCLTGAPIRALEFRPSPPIFS